MKIRKVKKQKRSEPCPRCGTPTPTDGTISLPGYDEEYKNMRVKIHRIRNKHCPNCGLAGSERVLLLRTDWADPETGEKYEAL